MTISPNQISESIGVPASTVRRWAQEFENHLSPRKGKKRTYTPADLDVFRRIRDLSGEGFSLKKIHDQLTVIEPAPSSTELVVIADFARAVATVQNENELLRQRIQQQDDRLKAIEEFLSRPWWKRIFQPPPK